MKILEEEGTKFGKSEIKTRTSWNRYVTHKLKVRFNVVVRMLYLTVGSGKITMWF